MMLSAVVVVDVAVVDERSHNRNRAVPVGSVSLSKRQVLPSWSVPTKLEHQSHVVHNIHALHDNNLKRLLDYCIVCFIQDLFHR